MIICWFCRKETGISETDYGDHNCINCGVEIAVYNPANHIPIPPETELDAFDLITKEKERNMQPKMYEVEILKDMKVEEKVKIIGEIRPSADINAKFRGFLMGEVEYQGEKYYVSINKTSYARIAGVYGSDTKDWIGKEIAYKGEQKCGAMTGKIWEAVG